MDLKALRDWFNSEEGKNKTEAYFLKLKKQREIELSQIERLHQSNKFNELTQKVIEKYNSDEYNTRWYNRGIFPPFDLYWFLFSYVEKYGRKCDKNEWKKYSNSFTTDLLFLDGWYFQVMQGQGSIIKIDKA